MKTQKHCLIFIWEISAEINTLVEPMLNKSLYAFCLTVFGCLLLLIGSVHSDVTVLKEIAEAEQGIGYVGVRLKIFGTRTLEEVVIHKSLKDSYRKVLPTVGGESTLSADHGREGDQDTNDRNRDRRRRDREFRWERQRSQFSTKEMELIAQNYKIERRPWGEKIAGHQADLLIIRPKYPNRPTKHIYFARENSVILRVEDFDSAGVRRNMFVYTRIGFDTKAVDARFKSIQKEISRSPGRNLPEITLAEAQKVLTRKLIKPQYLPSGFQLQRLHKHQYRSSHPIQLRYTDGMLDFNLYETIDKGQNRDGRNRGGEEIKIGDIPVRKYRRGPTHAFNWSSSGIHFFLSSPLPESEMVKIVESIIDPKTKQK